MLVKELAVDTGFCLEAVADIRVCIRGHDFDRPVNLKGFNNGRDAR